MEEEPLERVGVDVKKREQLAVVRLGFILSPTPTSTSVKGIGVSPR